MSNGFMIRKEKEFKTSLWSGGSTTELYIYPEDAQYKEGNFQCRISSATVEVDQSEFTSLPGVKRYLSIFSGHLDMIHGEADKVSLEPYEVDCFDGGVSTVSYGKVVDFNLMLKNGADGKMEAVKLGMKDHVTFSPQNGENLLAVYVKTGKIKIEDVTVMEGELFVCCEWDKVLEAVNECEGETGLGICRMMV